MCREILDQFLDCSERQFANLVDVWVIYSRDSTEGR